MRMKEDAMLNGQLKPAYNLQHGVDSEYVTWVGIYPNPTDMLTLIPFLKDMEKYQSFKYKNIVADGRCRNTCNCALIKGAIVHLGERLHGMQEVTGSSPASSIGFFIY